MKLRWFAVWFIAMVAVGVCSAQGEKMKANRLIHEKSPYLLQHAHNPVDWYPWGEEAFAKAKREDKPIFLSIGYSTCYWCHVMEKESFENLEVAKLLNDNFVPIKVDREERPDVDAIYMSAVQAMTGRGGWPMSVFLTPDRRPFWGGTYFPPEERWGQPGFKSVLNSIAQAWRTQREKILSSSQSLTEAIGQNVRAPSAGQLTAGTLETAVKQYAQQYDPEYGGFGPAPKFPRSHALSFLLRAWRRTGDPQTLKMVEHTLDAMHRGGMHDQIGGGFHRYSTDAKWLVPHFEKMLYDQALLARSYLEAYQVTGTADYAEAARGIFEYVLRDMRDPGGAFYSAEDAGEVGKEGEFYLWTPAQVEKVLGPKEAAFFNRFYDVTAGGNFEHAASIPNVPVPLETFAKRERVPVEDLRKRLNESSVRLLVARSTRARPHRDDKILTDWNGLMIGALACGARVLEEPRYAQAAQEAARFLLTHLQQEGHLLHRYRDGEVLIPAFLDDYAFLSAGLMDLYEATLDPHWLAEAKRLTQETVQFFWDESRGGFLFSGRHNEQLIAQSGELYDGAVPSGNSVAALNLLRLGQWTTEKDFQARAKKLFEAFSGDVANAPHAVPQFLIALDFWLGPPQEIVIAGDPAAPETRAMLRAVHQKFLPHAVLALHPSDKTAGAIEALVPFLKEQQPTQGKTTAYVCQNYTCNLPTTDLSTLNALLDEKSS